MLRKLTEEAWELYLKILDADRHDSQEREDRLNRLTDQAYYRYVRRRKALELHIIIELNRQQQGEL